MKEYRSSYFASWSLAWYFLKSSLKFDTKLHVLIVVKNLESFIINCHDTIVWIFVRKSCNTWWERVKTSQFWLVGKWTEESKMISVRMSLKLSSNNVWKSFYQCVKSDTPLIQRFGRNMANDVNKLIFSLRLFKFIFNPF